MEQITIKNDFHNTEFTTSPVDGCLTKKAIGECKEALCGLSDCLCGGDFGERGPQDYGVYEILENTRDAHIYY